MDHAYVVSTVNDKKILQKKSVRNLAFKPYIPHSTPIFIILKILQLEDFYTMQLCKFNYKNTNNLLPSNGVRTTKSNS